ncbi:MAG TPA: hypothetical protein VIF09_26860, partial [Polyangiaceae bacterium]
MRSALPFLALSTLSIALAAQACGGSTENGAQPATDAGAEAGDDAAVAETGAADVGPDVDNGAPSTNYPAPHPPLPTLTNVAGGSVLKTPKVYLVFYAGYPYETQLETMAQNIGATSYWSAATQEYGIGAVQYAGKIELTDTPPQTITDTAIDTFMNGKIAGGAFGTPDPSTIYTIFYPTTTTITLSSGGPFGSGQSCTSFGGYHQDTAVTVGDGGTPQNYAYAVLPTCSGTINGLSGLDSVSGALSHEWVEAVTDPFPSTNNGADSAFSQVDMDHFIWAVTGGGTEAGDLCVGELDAFFKPANLAFTVQRTWSNQLAKASHDPCAPNYPGEAFFDSAPVLNENVTFTSQFIGGTVNTKGVTIPVGQSKTIEVDLFSDAATSGPWTVGPPIDVVA